MQPKVQVELKLWLSLQVIVPLRKLFNLRHCISRNKNLNNILLKLLKSVSYTFACRYRATPLLCSKTLYYWRCAVQHIARVACHKTNTVVGVS